MIVQAAASGFDAAGTANTLPARGYARPPARSTASTTASPARLSAVHGGVPFAAPAVPLCITIGNRPNLCAWRSAAAQEPGRREACPQRLDCALRNPPPSSGRQCATPAPVKRGQGIGDHWVGVASQARFQHNDGELGGSLVGEEAQVLARFAVAPQLAHNLEKACLGSRASCLPAALRAQGECPVCVWGTRARAWRGGWLRTFSCGGLDKPAASLDELARVVLTGRAVCWP